MTQHEILQKYITGLTKGLGNSLVVVSPAGYGKTEMTLNTLTEMGYQEGKDYRYISNYITPLELFKLLDEVNHLAEPKLLVLDDTEEILNEPKVIGLLKSALWATPDGKRKVCWYSGTYKIKEKEFDFTGRIILLLNKLNKKNPIINSLIDRGLFYEIQMTKSEILELIKARAELPYQNIPYNQRLKIAEFISQRSGENISLRVLPKIYNLFLLSPNSWQTLAEKILV